MKSQKECCFLNGQELYLSVIGDGKNDPRVVSEILMLELGFKGKLMGTLYLEYAILYMYNNCGERHMHSQELYEEIAKWARTSLRNVEKAIRTAITDCFEHGNLEALNEMLHCQAIMPDCAPSNTELISLICRWMLLEKRRGHIADLKD